MSEVRDSRDPALICAALAPLLGEERMRRIDEVVDARLSSLTVVVENSVGPVAAQTFASIGSRRAVTVTSASAVPFTDDTVPDSTGRSSTAIVAVSPPPRIGCCGTHLDA